jgi:hypothetical protein
MTEAAQSTDAAPQTADSRSTSFEAVPAGSEHYSGEALLVSAYAILWAILLLWVALVWRKQGAVDMRLRDLEREIDKAAAKTGDKRHS